MLHDGDDADASILHFAVTVQPFVKPDRRENATLDAACGMVRFHEFHRRTRLMSVQAETAQDAGERPGQGGSRA